MNKSPTERPSRTESYLRAFGTLVLLFCSIDSRYEAHGDEILRTVDHVLEEGIYSEGETTIPGLSWKGDNGKPEFTVEALKDGKPAARMSGRINSKNVGNLIFSSDVLLRATFSDDRGNFSILVPLKGRKTPVQIQYIDDYGNRISQNIQIIYEKFYQFQLNEQTKKRWNYDGGVSLSYLDYKQAAAAIDVKIAQMGVTPKFGVTYNASRKLDIGGSVFGTLVGVPIKSAPTGLSTPRFYGVNMRIGYKIYGLSNANIYLMTGPYLWGMIVPPSPNGLNYGILKLTGPQLFLVGRFLTPTGRTGVGYLKAASILDGDGGMAKNTEFAVGGAYQITPPKAPRRFMMNLDFATANFVVLTEKIQLNSVSLGISTSL